jgi:putative transposase
VGVDLGVADLATTSDGEIFVGGQFGPRTRTRLADAQRSVSSKQRGSKRRSRQVARVAQLHRKVANPRRNAAHQLSRRLVDDYDLLVLEDLRISNMVRSPEPRPDPDSPGEYLPNGAAAKAGLNRSIHDAGWGELRSMLSHKAESAGRTVVIVDPRYTSQRCAECGHVEAGNRATQAVFRCRECGHEDHADVNAARNILRAGKARLASASVGSD